MRTDVSKYRWHCSKSLKLSVDKAFCGYLASSAVRCYAAARTWSQCDRGVTHCDSAVRKDVNFNENRPTDQKVSYCNFCNGYQYAIVPCVGHSRPERQKECFQKILAINSWCALDYFYWILYWCEKVFLAKQLDRYHMILLEWLNEHEFLKFINWKNA